MGGDTRMVQFWNRLLSIPFESSNLCIVSAHSYHPFALIFTQNEKLFSEVLADLALVVCKLYTLNILMGGITLIF